MSPPLAVCAYLASKVLTAGSQHGEVRIRCIQLRHELLPDHGVMQGGGQPDDGKAKPFTRWRDRDVLLFGECLHHNLLPSLGEFFANPPRRLPAAWSLADHAAALSALVEAPNGYRFYFAVYVQSVGRLTPFYMAAIDPFRKLIVYPSLLRSMRAKWDRTMAALGS